MEKAVKFEDLGVWRKAHQLVISIYDLTKQFPADEKFGLVSQMRRAAVSIPANIAEGFNKRGKKDKINFYNISQGSLGELRYYLLLARDLKYMSDISENEVLIEEIGRMLNGLISRIQDTV